MPNRPSSPAPASRAQAAQPETHRVRPAARNVTRRLRIKPAIAFGGLVVSLFTAATLALRGIHPFLACTDPVSSCVIVVEGWVPDYAVAEALESARAQSCDQVFTTGGPISVGALLSPYRSFANVAAATLVNLGWSSNRLTVVPAPDVHRNRTFESAVALREYCRTNGIQLENLNVFTLGAHARRTRLCFQRALGPKVSVGVVAIEDRSYDPAQWWRFSQGIKTVGGETLACAYAWASVDYGD